ncbi:hypothetical protein [Marinobacter sp. ELB17]|nr:hypothetical protein [Marinobacter sp. ELB17]EBA00187.1 hypothetical protein MELB17_17533 [Marinobacter sp. ELB17]
MLGHELTALHNLDRAIDKTQAFFESMGVKTHLVDYQLGEVWWTPESRH